ncbi:M56 family metallopeptidase [Intestinibacillus massiliensis]|nr:M56 family metallopeptidase [Intestinibacillus massiliensis]
MTLLQMGLSGAAFIAAVLLLRRLALHRLPKRTFVVLWLVVLCRLLLPFDVASPASVYTLLGQARGAATPQGGFPAVALPAAVPPPALEAGGAPAAPAAADTPSTPAPARETPAVPWAALAWGCGCAGLSLFFLLSYLRCRRVFRDAQPACHPFAARWLQAHRLLRPVQIRQSAHVASPLTFGVLRPVILLPAAADWTDETALSYILEHEFIHIRRFDALTKLLLTAALCLHWCNPLVWLMSRAAGRDIELACDEAVVRRLGGRAGYAMALIGMEQRKGALLPLHFSQNATEERITAIMKTKKATLAAGLAAACLIAGLTAAFATSAPAKARAAQPPTLSGTPTHAPAPSDALAEVSALLVLPAEAEPPAGLTDAQAAVWRYEMRHYSTATLGRLKSVTENEAAELLHVLDRESEGGTSNREPTSGETGRRRVLDRAYLAGERFPVGTLPTTPGAFYYDPDTFVMHYPDAAMTDEQLLQEVERYYKLNYCIFMRNLLDDPAPAVPNTPTAAQALAARTAVERFFGADLAGLPIDWMTREDGGTEFTFGLLDPLPGQALAPAYSAFFGGGSTYVCPDVAIILRDPDPAVPAQEVPEDYAPDVAALRARAEALMRDKAGVTDPVTHTILYTRRSQLMLQLTGESGKAYLIGLQYPDLSCQQFWIHDAPLPAERLLGSGKFAYRLLYEG